MPNNESERLITAPEIPADQKPQPTPDNTGQVQRRWEDRSGKIVTTNVLQVVAEENMSRRSIVIQNQGANSMWVDFDPLRATNGVPAFQIAPGNFFKVERETGFVPTGRVTIVGTQNDTYAAREA